MKMVTLGEVAEINPRASAIDRNEAISFVGMAQLDAGSGVASASDTRSFEEVSRGYTVFRNGDILAAKITPCWENGKVGQAKLDNPIGVGSTEFHVLRPTRVLADRYLLHFLRQSSVRQSGQLRMTGSGGQRRVPVNFLQDLQIPLPSVAEQRRIAAILDHADALRTKRRQVLAHLDTLTQAIFNHIFGPPSTWPRTWPMGTIGDLAGSVSYGTSAKAGEDGRWPILRMGNITDEGRIDLSDLKFIDLSPGDEDKYTVKLGDMLFNRTNSKEKVGKAAVVRTTRPLAVAGYLLRVRFADAATAEFVSAYLTGSHGQAVRRRLAKAAVNQANINATEMRHIDIALPPQELLESFAKSINAVERERERVGEAAATLNSLFSSLQSRAFRGEL